MSNKIIIPRGMIYRLQIKNMGIFYNHDIIFITRQYAQAYGTAWMLRYFDTEWRWVSSAHAEATKGFNDWITIVHIIPESVHVFTEK